MKFIGVLCYIGGFAVGLFLVLLPAIFTWSALFDSIIAGVLFSIFVFPIAVLGYPIVILVAGLTTGIGGTTSVLAAISGYIMMGVVAGLWALGSWLFDKSEQRAYERQRQFYYPATPQLPESNYVGNSRTRIFHNIDCPRSSQISDDSCVWFESSQEAIAQGFRPCKNCTPEY